MFLNIEDMDKMNETTEYSKNIQNIHKIIKYNEYILIIIIYIKYPFCICKYYISNQSCEFNIKLDTAEHNIHKIKN